MMTREADESFLVLNMVSSVLAIASESDGDRNLNFATLKASANLQIT